VLSQLVGIIIHDIQTRGIERECIELRPCGGELFEGEEEGGKVDGLPVPAESDCAEWYFGYARVIPVEHGNVFLAAFLVVAGIVPLQTLLSPDEIPFLQTEWTQHCLSLV
jgi:hypothetical protein